MNLIFQNFINTTQRHSMTNAQILDELPLILLFTNENLKSFQHISRTTHPSYMLHLKTSHRILTAKSRWELVDSDSLNATPMRATRALRQRNPAISVCHKFSICKIRNRILRMSWHCSKEKRSVLWRLLTQPAPLTEMPNDHYQHNLK